MHLGNKTLKPLFESKAMFMSFREEWVRFEEVANKCFTIHLRGSLLADRVYSFHF